MISFKNELLLLCYLLLLLFQAKIMSADIFIFTQENRRGEQYG